MPPHNTSGRESLEPAARGSGRRLAQQAADMKYNRIVTTLAPLEERFLFLLGPL